MSDTLYLRIARDLAEAIRTGRYPVGSKLPTEMELLELYGASRHTVRAALRELQELGLVSRRKKAGTRVEASAPTGSFRHSIASVADLVQFGVAHRRVVRTITEIAATRTLANRLGCPAGKRWLRISSLRMDQTPGSAPIGWTDVYIDPAYSELGREARESPETLISSLIESRFGRRITEIRQDVRAIAMPAALAKPLAVDARSPALEVTRRYFDAAGSALEISITVHPADRFTLSSRLTRDRGGADIAAAAD